MARILHAHFDGQALIPDKPVRLPKGKRLRITIEDADAIAQNGKKRKIIGQGRFASGISDLGSNKRHLRGLGQ